MIVSLTSHHLVQHHINQYVGSSPSNSSTAVYNDRRGSASEAFVHFPAEEIWLILSQVSSSQLRYRMICPCLRGNILYVCLLCSSHCMIVLQKLQKQSQHQHHSLNKNYHQVLQQFSPDI